MATDGGRAARLNKAFWDFLHGIRAVRHTQDAEHFLEGLRTQPSPSSCLEVILGSPSGLSALQSSVRASSSSQFIRAHVLPSVGYFDQPEAKAICEGAFLHQVIEAIVEPPTAWRSILKHYSGGEFADKDAEAFAWLCLEIVTHPKPELSAFTSEINSTLKLHPLISDASPKTRELGYRIEKVLQIKLSPNAAAEDDIDGPGGRHDNDFADFRKVSIYPTRDELSSALVPFYRRAEEVANSDPAEKTGKHLDNQFRLLREDMLAELRDDIRITAGQKKGKGRAQILGDLFPVGIDTGDEKRGRQCALQVSVGSGLEQLAKKSTEQRKRFLSDTTGFLRHHSFGALCLNGAIVGFAFVVRNVDDLIKQPPVVSLQFTSSGGVKAALSSFAKAQGIKFFIIDTPVFAYEPVLERLKEIIVLPLDKELLQPSAVDVASFTSACALDKFVLRSDSSNEKRISIGGRSYSLDEAQVEALRSTLERSLAVIQGPPGTGKSFVGALAARLLLEDPNSRILILSYTNHALDQFLEDLLKIEINQDRMTRLGSKHTSATVCLSFESQFRRSEVRRTKAQNTLWYQLKEKLNGLRFDIDESFERLAIQPSLPEILDYLEFSDTGQLHFWRAFQVPHDEEGFSRAGGKGRVMAKDYLLSRWQHGKDPGALGKYIAADCKPVWNIPQKTRVALKAEWVEALRAENLLVLQGYLERFNDIQHQIDVLFNESKCAFIKTKRVIGCTTTAAAKYASLIKAAEPAFVLVEEAGEILEAHVLTALSPSTKGLILIGDHKQLRPKCKNYALSVEKGAGYDLNRSLFERLILQGVQHTTLRKQHRMVPEISQLIRSMTYPELNDGQKTLERPQIRGLRDRVVFVNHSHPEGAVNEIGDGQDAGQKTSKENKFEADMILKTVKYLGQQGYKTDNIVVLTPYLGQLRLLRDMLSKDNDPLLGDLDSYELIRAGLLTAAAGKVNTGRIRLSTIDNYQGEESDIVVASLTRSNNRGDVGFMKAPERLNVLLSRARNGLILFGNMETFLASPHGADCWIPFFDLMKEKGYLQDGVVVHCEQHPERTSVLSTPQDFDLMCPDGGCSEPCGVKLQCRLHTCQRRCHRVADHSNITCDHILQKMCEKKHTYDVQCGNASARCLDCVKEEEDIKRRAKRDLIMEKDRLAKQDQYRKELLIIQDEVEHLRRRGKYKQEEEDQARNLQQQRADLEALKQTSERQESMKINENEAKRRNEKTSPKSTKGKDLAANLEPGSARHEWECQKREELASSNALDELMGMIGLESIKKAFLNIKSTVDTATRQGVSTAKERFGVSLLGNPGTGKTTVARLYAKFLTSVGVIAGSRFEEVSGSKLANMGVSGCQKLLDDVLDAGGGVIFIDEAYQLSSGNSPGGNAVLDFLLAEIENQRSKICFVLAGYSKQMEPFFAHNPGFPSRFPLEMKFDDYTDAELLQILIFQVDSKYGGRMKAEDGLEGLYCRIVARRLGHGRGKEGFGNARAVENQLGIIYRRQSERLRCERREGLRPDDLLLTRNDLLGPEPADALLQSEAWAKLQQLIGLASVKQSIQSLVDSIKTNYQRELKEEPIIEYCLNRVFLGNTGTGKTTIAKLYGQVLADIGLLSNGEVVVKNPSDFVGSALGQSEKQTNGILAATVGKVLVIDEAYGLYGGGASQGGGFSDPYKTAVVDTIVATVHSAVGDDRCVLLLGYHDQMEEMFQNVNPGLSRRFPLSSAFTFKDFTQSELNSILELKLKQQSFGVTEKARQVALEMLDRARNRPNFGNAGEVDILLNEAKSRHQARLSSGQTKRPSTLEALDFDENYDRLERADTNVAQLFNDTVGCERIVAILEGYQKMTKATKKLGLDPKEQISFSFIFRGPPGTGKSTTARKMGKVFYDAGFLSSANVHDCSASDLIGQYVGQTGPKVRKLLDKALGSVLLIDEAYRLREGHFAKEALDELVDALTKERYHKRLIIILAGYENDINALLEVNPGLTSRFPEVIDFHSLTPLECFDLLTKRLLRQKTLMEKGRGKIDIECLRKPSIEFEAKVCELFENLAKMPSWGSARAVETVAKMVFQSALMATSNPEEAIIPVTEAIVLVELVNMAKERNNRSNMRLKENLRPMASLPLYPTMQQHSPPQVSRESVHAASIVRESQVAGEQQQDQGESLDEAAHKATVDPVIGCYGAARDAGVSDAVWEQLQKDAQEEQQREQEYQAKLRETRETNDEELRQRILSDLIEEEERREKEAEAKKKLQMLGCCPAGYAWIRQSRGWRCAGGSHFLSESAMEKL